MSSSNQCPPSSDLCSNLEQLSLSTLFSSSSELSTPTTVMADCDDSASPQSPQTGSRTSRAPCLSNLAVEIKELIALKVQDLLVTNPSHKMDPHIFLQPTLRNPYLRQLGGTCREFWGLCRPLLWQTLKVTFDDTASTGILMELLPSIGWAVSGAYFKGFLPIQEGRDRHELYIQNVLDARDIIQLCPNLRTCRLDVPSANPTVAAASSALVQALGSLERLSNITVGPFFRDALHLAIPAVDFVQHLHHLRIVACCMITADDSQPLADHLATLQNLEQLTLVYSPSLLVALTKSRPCNSIRSLRVDSSTCIDRVALNAFTSSLASSLVDLDVSVRKPVSSNRHHLFRLPHLQTLTIRAPLEAAFLHAFTPCISLATIRLIGPCRADFPSIDAWINGPLPPSLRAVMFNNYGRTLPENVSLEKLEGRGVHVERVDTLDPMLILALDAEEV